MHESIARLGPVDVAIVAPARQLECAELMVVFLHGHAMRPSDLSPFASSLSLPGTCFVFPRAPLALADDRYAWWSIDEEARAQALRSGPRDLAEAAPPGREPARRVLNEMLAALRAAAGDKPVLLAGFSQGGMLACDSVLVGDTRVAGLAMLSSSRIAIAEWEAQQARLQGKPLFVSHGRNDPDLAFAAGERLRDFFQQAGAQVQWVPFDGGHEIPFVVWRHFRRFVTAVLSSLSPHLQKEPVYGTH